MVRQLEQIIQEVKAYNPQAEVDLLRRAFEFSAKAHAGQVRDSGEPFLQHPLQVAEIITILKLDVPSIVAGLLHDTVEDTSATIQEIEQNFGKEVSRLVDGLTKISKIEFKSHEDKQAE